MGSTSGSKIRPVKGSPGAAFASPKTMMVNMINIGINTKHLRMIYLYITHPPVGEREHTWGLYTPMTLFVILHHQPTTDEHFHTSCVGGVGYHVIVHDAPKVCFGHRVITLVNLQKITFATPHIHRLDTLVQTLQEP